MSPRTPPISSIRSYYDEFAQQFLVDYVHGNPRIERAIDHALRSVPEGAQDILDIGCGIGWSTAEFARHLPKASVTGIDLSESSISIARRMFVDFGIRFDSTDVTDPAWHPERAFDVAVMIDVYEHIPEVSRGDFNRSLGTLLRDDGLIILSFPSAAHQEFLAEHQPEGLQPIDETISEETLAQLASDVGGRVELWEPVTIWNSHDYVHAVVQKGASRNKQVLRARASSVEDPRRRVERARTRLGVRVTRDGYVIPDQPGPAVLVVSPIRNAYSETFIKAHIEGLPTRVEVLFGVPPRAEDDQGRRLSPKWARGVKYILDQVLGSRLSARLDSYWLDRFLKSRGIRAVLAEYGSTGARLVDACRRRSIPLVTYFYGFDASDRDVLEELRVPYARLLGGGSVIVAVSRDLENRLYELGAVPGSIHCIPCGVDAERFSGAAPADNPPIFLAVGRFVEKKAPHLTLLAFSSVLKRVPDAQLLMVGDGPLLGACQQMARALDLGESVRFLGPRPHRQLAGLLQSARAFVQHSITAPSGDSEGTPIAILEAGASGVPVVATRHGGIPEIVVEGETGYLVDEGDIVGMAEQMIRLARDPELAGRLGSQARAHISQQFTLELSLDRLWHVVIDAMAIRHPLLDSKLKD